MIDFIKMIGFLIALPLWVASISGVSIIVAYVIPIAPVVIVVSMAYAYYTFKFGYKYMN